MASNAPYDPNRVPYELEKLNSNEIETPLLNRATQGLLPAGLDLQGRDRRGGARKRHDHAGNDDRRAGHRSKSKGTPLQNDFTEDFGPIALDTALTNSVNTWFGQLGQQVGQDTLFEYMEKFGFNSTPPIDLPADEVYDSGVYDENDDLLTANDPVDLARVAIGQERLLATPLQMARSPPRSPTGAS